MKKGVAVAKLRLGVGRDQGSALVVVMQNAELRDGHDAPASWRLDVSRLGAVAPERQMGAHGVVVIDIGAKQASEMPFVDHDEVVEGFPADGAYDALGERILPRRVGRDQNLMNAHVVDAAVNLSL